MMRTLAITLGLLLLLFLPAVALADGPSSCTYLGSVKLDNAEVADGALITAVIAGDEYHTHTSSEYGYSTYSLTISAIDGTNYPDGTKVTFQINGHPTGQTAVYKAGAKVRLDLAASTASGLSPSSAALVSGLVIAVLAAIVAAYFLLVRRPGIRILDRLRRKGSVPSGQALLLSVDGGGQPASRYIWDNATLAWVLNTVPKQGKSLQAGQDTSIMVEARKQSFTSKQAMPVAAQISGRPISTYIWDGAKLAWVENPELAKSQPRIEELVISGMGDGVPTMGSARAARRRGRDISIMAHARDQALSQGQEVPMAVERQQPMLRYIWDNAKLAWVENTKPATIRPQTGPTPVSARMRNVPIADSAAIVRQTEIDTYIPVTSQSQAVGQDKSVDMTGKEYASLYHGNMQLMVESPLGLNQLRKFSAGLRSLRRSHMVRITRVSVSSGESVSFELFLAGPTPLLEVLKGLPEVATISETIRSRLVEVKLES
jgi:hypothetical protein